MMRKPPTINVLTIAGSDSGGASGIQADLRTFARFGLHGLSAVTAVTAQNLHEVVSVHCVPAREIEQQLRVLFKGFRIDAVKIGMLGSATNVVAIALANKLARIAWAVLTRDQAYRSAVPTAA